MSAVEKYIRLIQLQDTPVIIKNRAIFYLRTLQSEEAALALHECIIGDSVLIDHEIAYVLGQMKQPVSKKFLLEVSFSDKYDPIVRHEAIEALGNFEDQTLIDELKDLLNHEVDLIRESAVLAIDKLKQENEGISLYGSRDPAYASKEENLDVLIKLLKTGTLVEKYQSMFKLRDMNTKESVYALAEGFKDTSGLLRHEIAYIFGQMENIHSIDCLEVIINNDEEEGVVRHEAAEALGAIGTERCKEILRQYLDSDIRILRESCEVGLEIADKDIDEYLNV